jgi:hypothetical protein
MLLIMAIGAWLSGTMLAKPLHHLGVRYCGANWQKKLKLWLQWKAFRLHLLLIAQLFLECDRQQVVTAQISQRRGAHDGCI